MKKLSALLLLSVIYTISGFAQRYYPFINESKKWRYVQTICLTGSNSCVNFVEQGYFKGDTLIDSYKYHPFYLKQEQPSLSDAYISYYFREDTINRQVYIYDPNFNKKALLYDFSLNKGDSFNIYLLDDIYKKKMVINVDTVMTYDKKLKRIIFEDSTTWIEGIGCVTHTFIPSEGELICMKENDSVLYLNEKYENCDTIFSDVNSIESKQIKNNSLSVFPNPIEKSSVLEIEDHTDENLKIEIYDGVGLLIKVDSFREKYPIGSISLRKGIYFCRVISDNRILGVNKLIVK